jgi:hypothetical protein
MAFLPLLFFAGLALLFDLDDLEARAALPFAFELLVGLLFFDAALAFELFFAGRLAAPDVFPLFFDDFFAPPFEPDDLATALALAATFLTAFFTGAAEERPAARPASAPITPPTTAPTGPAMLPKTAPVAAPAVCLEIGGISMFSEDEAGVSVDCWFSSGIRICSFQGNKLFRVYIQRTSHGTGLPAVAKERFHGNSPKRYESPRWQQDVFPFDGSASSEKELA